MSNEQPLQLLLVEDNPADADLIRRYLKRSDLHPVNLSHVTRLDAACEQLCSDSSRLSPDVILLDLFLPDAGGVDGISQLRQLAADIPIVALTGQSVEGLALQTLREHAQDYLLKDELSPTNMSRSIRYSIERQAMQGQLQSLLAANPDGVVVVNKHKQVLHQNHAAKQLLQAHDKNTQDIEWITSEDEISDRELRISEQCIISLNIASITWSGEDAFIITIRNITERKLSEQRLIKLARHDALTGLANRSLCIDYLLKSIARAERKQGRCAILFLDLDKFKQINDQLGHNTGDQLLKSVAARLSANVRTNDLACRLSGDEFVLILDDIKTTQDVAVVAQKIINALSLPHKLGEHEIKVGCSLGIATYPESGKVSAKLMQAADTAMYQAKSMRGSNNFQFYTRNIDNHLDQSAQLEQDLRHALENDQLQLQYRPIFSLPEQQLVGAHALLRWQHPQQGLLAPSQFLALAEKSGLISELQNWLFQNACSGWQNWPEQPPLVWLEANSSHWQLNINQFDQNLALALHQGGLNPGQIQLCVHEASLLSTPTKAKSQIEKLRKLGVQIAINDFGTANSSLLYLADLPFSTLTIASSLVSQIEHDERICQVIKTLIYFSHSLGKSVLAYGVDSQLQMDFLSQHGCKLVQGGYFGNTLSQKDLLTLWQQSH